MVNYILYDANNQVLTRLTKPGPYTVDGSPAILPENVYQLEIVNLPPSDYSTATHKLIEGEWAIDLDSLTYTKLYSVVEKTTYEIAVEDWVHMDYDLRIKCPIAFVMDDIGLKFHNWFIACGYPIERNGGYLYAYCNTISPDHQAIVDQLLLANIIELHNRPVEE